MEGEFERVAGDAGDVRPDGPGESIGNGAGEGDGFELEIEAAVAFLPGPVRVLAPEVAVVFGGGEGALGRRAGVGDFRDARAARGAVSVVRVELPEDDVVGGVEDDGEDVALADAHEDPEVVAVLAEDAGAQDLWREDPRVGGEIAEEPVKAVSGGSGDEDRGAPVVEESSGQRVAVRRRELLDDQTALAQAGLVFGVESGAGEEGGGRGVLAGEAGFDRGDVILTGGKRRGCGLISKSGRGGEKEESAEERPEPGS